MGLELRLLGTPQVMVDGAPLQVDTRKAIALLAYLAVAGPRQGRDRLAGLLWPDSPDDRARAALRRTLSVLSSALGGRWVSADRSLVTLDVDAIECDATAVRTGFQTAAAHPHDDPNGCARCRAELTAAVARCDGEFMEGFVLRDAPEFEDWHLLEAEAIRRECSSALERLVTMDVAADDLEAALGHARRWLELDPLHEQAHRIVMQLAAWLGRRDEAVRQYRACVGVLDRELGVAPLPVTTALHDAIVAGEVAARAPAPVLLAPPPIPPPVGPSSVATLVGRDTQLSALTELHERAATTTLVAAVVGEAGIGKTRLWQELLATADDGVASLVARCHEDEADLACAPIVDLLRAALEQPGWLVNLSPVTASEVGRLLPEVGDRRPDVPAALPLDSPGAQARFFGGIRDALAAAVAGPRPGIVVIDDVQWADPTTIDLLGFLGRRTVAGGPLVVVAWRSEAVPHDHPVRRLAAPDATIPLGRLDADEVAELVTSLRPGAEALVDPLYEETQGIPFFVVEYLAVVDATDGELRLPAPVRDLLHERLRHVSQLAGQVLTAAAILGRSADLATLVRTSGRAEDEVVEALEELVASHLLEESESGDGAELRYGFTHPRIRDVAVDTTSLARRRVLHRRAARALTTGGRDGSIAARAAHHLREAGLDEEAAVQFAAAARHARSLYANREAVRHLETAIGLGHGDVAGLQRELGELHTLAGRYREALHAFATAQAHAVEPCDVAVLAWRTGDVHARSGEPEVAAAHLAEAVDLLADADCPDIEARVLADLALAVARGGDPADAVPTAERALERAEASGEATARAQAHNILGVLARQRGDTVVARDHLAAALVDASEVDDPTARIAALNNLALALIDEGEPDSAIEDLRQAADLCAAIGDLHREAALHNNLADALHALGREEESMTHLKRAVALFAEVGDDDRPQPEIWKLVDW